MSRKLIVAYQVELDVYLGVEDGFHKVAMLYSEQVILSNQVRFDKQRIVKTSRKLRNINW